MRRLALCAAALVALALLAGCATLLLDTARPQLDGRITGLPVTGRVDVLRDSHGIPHIFASSERDLWVAQGFVHAQDRMWQMETLRRLTDGRLSEIAGRRTAAMDVFCRLLGLADMKRRMLADLSPAELSALQAYSEGVNAYLRMRGRDLPVEFSSLGYIPEPWKPVDSLSFLALLSWEMVFGHYTEEVVALARGASFTEAEWNDAFPSWPNTELPRETFFDAQSHLLLGKLIPAALCFHFGLDDKDSAEALQKRLFSQASPGGGSNNWVVASSADGLPLLANDPHLGVTLPATWYMCHVSCPGLNAAGVSVAGTPGIVLGRNEHVAWGATNTMIDGADTVIFRVDPADPERYVAGGREYRMERQEIVLR
ncbi:MAG TPA: penicillin acylase family protein, partial [Spirochaetia bacterium]|nr:penicillin acylase family protein [Spirochaetia bacterium]